MMKRRNFLRDIALGIAATLLPRALQPIDSVMQDEMVDIVCEVNLVLYNDDKALYSENYTTLNPITFTVPKRTAELLATYDTRP